jgi:phenylpropionate dioxygenase-like ring-hydroxylating dioxygenase large terminal subunit
VTPSTGSAIQQRSEAVVSVQSSVTESDIDYGALIQEDRFDGSVYTDPRIFEDEFDRIWHRGWIYVGHESEIAESGDYSLRQMGRVLIMTRADDGEVHLLLNRCPHRGNRVVNDDQGNSRNFQCAYHAWTFKNNGALLGVPYPQGYGKNFDKSVFCMAKVPRVSIYRGFIFASLAESGITFDEHIGDNGKLLIDRLCDVAPDNEIAVRSGSLKHRMKCNWKMVVENDTDGYHPQFVHAALMKVRISPKRASSGQPKRFTLHVRDWGNGHAELDSRPMRREMGDKGGRFGWLPAVGPAILDTYAASLERRVGKERAEQIFVDGPPHATIFPNLFLGQLNIIVVQPVAPNETIQYVSPISLKGAPELDSTILVHSQGGLGPAGLLFADDDEIAERNQLGLAAGEPRLIYLGRGVERQTMDDESLFSDGSDETSQRAFWKRYRTELMESPVVV